MREILFRGRRKNDGKWCYGDFIRCGVRMYIRDRVEYYYTEVEPKTVGQFTGLTDKNGVKIFEGDIVKSRSYGVFAVEWHDGQFTAESVDGWLFMFEVKSGEVIGNIHDNPELIEGMDIKPATKRGDAPAEQLGLAPAT